MLRRVLREPPHRDVAPKCHPLPETGYWGPFPKTVKHPLEPGGGGSGIFGSSAMVFHVILDPAEDGWAVAEVPALPGCVSQGQNDQEALENIKEL